MQTSSINNDLSRFLELKKAAEMRMNLAPAAKTQSAPQVKPAAQPANPVSGPAAAFADLIKALRGKDDNSNGINRLNTVSTVKTARPSVSPRVTNPAHIAPAAQIQERGLLSAYTVGRLATEAVNTVNGTQEAVPKRSLGNLFDATA